MCVCESGYNYVYAFVSKLIFKSVENSENWNTPESV